MKKEKIMVYKKVIFLLVVSTILLFILAFFSIDKKENTVLASNTHSILNIRSILEKFYDISNEQTKNTPLKRDLSKYQGKKLIAFTFDDGPNSATTNLLLDGLEKYDAKVTFFISGTRISKNKEVIKKAYLEGHDIGSHTYSHKNLFRLKNSNILNEINKNNDSIREIIGSNPIYLRPPYGNVNKRINGLTDMYVICWDIDSLDWKYKNRNKIKDRILKTAHDGGIVLLHDIYEESIMGAFMAMEELEKQGYVFVTISEMVELKGITLDSDDVYYHF